MSPINNFKVTYEPVNKEDTFSAGDRITGEVTFTLTEEVKIKCLYVKVKGDADVEWTERHGYGSHHTYRTYSEHKRYYKAKQVLVAEKEDGTVLHQGDHRYPFELQIPEGDMPPSFKGNYGKIVHVVEAKLSRSWHLSTKDKKTLKFLSRTMLTVKQCPQSGCVEKSVGLLGDGKVEMTASVDKRICTPGDTLYVTAKVTNKSSEKMKVKCKIDKKVLFRDTRKAKIENKNVCKVVGDPVPANFEGEISCSITVPTDTELSLLNCEIITLEFYIKVYLDLCLDTDPEVLLPLIIVAPEDMVQ